MIYSNDHNLAKLNAEIAVLRSALVALIDVAGDEARAYVIANLAPITAEQMRAGGLPTVHIDALEEARRNLLKILGPAE